MRRLILTLALGVGLVLMAVWVFGGLDLLASWAAEGQRRFQNALADGLRRLRAGEAGALAGLMGLCFAYGFFHAAGPGHGKVLIGGYGVGSGVRLGPLMGIAVASSIAQATTAVILVYAGIFALGWTRERMIGVTEDVMAPLSYAAVGLIGLWLAWRGIRGLRRMRAATVHTDAPHGHARHDDTQVKDGAMAHSASHTHPHQHTHPHHHPHSVGGHCDTCGHRHGPTVAEVADVRGWRDAAVLIAGIALRPCTGALFLLILTWRMGLDAAGIAGAYAMGLGTASITLVVAILAVLARDGALMWLDRAGRARGVLPVLEIAAGSVIAMIALQLVLRSI